MLAARAAVRAFCRSAWSSCCSLRASSSSCLPSAFVFGGAVQMKRHMPKFCQHLARFRLCRNLFCRYYSDKYSFCNLFLRSTRCPARKRKIRNVNGRTYLRFLEALGHALELVQPLFLEDLVRPVFSSLTATTPRHCHDRARFSQTGNAASKEG